MIQRINERVVVGMSESPKWVCWKNRIYKIKKIGLHHTYYEGKVLYHIFSVVTDTLFMRLNLNTKNLLWTLEKVSENGI